MAVPNVFSNRTEDRSSVLRALAVLGALVGTGAAASYLTIPGLYLDLSLLYRWGLGAAILGGLLLSTTVWTMPRWDLAQTLWTTPLALLWLALGFTASPVLGAIPMILGATLLGTAAGGALTDRRWSAARPRTG